MRKLITLLLVVGLTGTLVTPAMAQSTGEQGNQTQTREDVYLATEDYRVLNVESDRDGIYVTISNEKDDEDLLIGTSDAGLSGENSISRVESEKKYLAPNTVTTIQIDAQTIGFGQVGFVQIGEQPYLLSGKPPGFSGIIFQEFSRVQAVLIGSLAGLGFMTIRLYKKFADKFDRVYTAKEIFKEKFN